jgi:hypothetical protein
VLVLLFNPAFTSATGKLLAAAEALVRLAALYDYQFVAPFFGDCVDLFGDSFEICNARKRGLDQNCGPLSFVLHCFSRTLQFYTEALEDSQKEEGGCYAQMKKKVVTEKGIQLDISSSHDSSLVQVVVLNMLHVAMGTKETGGAMQLMQGTGCFQRLCSHLCLHIEDHTAVIDPIVRSYCVRLSIEVVSCSTLTEWKQRIFCAAIDALRSPHLDTQDKRRVSICERSVASLICEVFCLPHVEMVDMLSLAWGGLSEMFHYHFSKASPARSLSCALCKVFIFGVEQGFLESHLQHLVPLLRCFQQSTYFDTEKLKEECECSNDGNPPPPHHQHHLA